MRPRAAGEAPQPPEPPKMGEPTATGTGMGASARTRVVLEVVLEVVLGARERAGAGGADQQLLRRWREQKEAGDGCRQPAASRRGASSGRAEAAAEEEEEER